MYIFIRYQFILNAAGHWRLATGGWQLVAGNWWLAGDFKFPSPFSFSPSPKPHALSPITQLGLK